MRGLTLSQKLYLVLVVGIIIAAFFLRIYRIPEYLTFLADQGRDAIILKRLVTFEKLVFVGPTTSIGNVFTGPFFYYLVAPFMALWWLNPVGPAYGIAIINTIGLILSFWFVYRVFGRVTALFFLVFIAFSSSQVILSRFTWNPNPVSMFSFLTLASFYYATSTRQLKWYLITGIMMGLDLQLHYITILLLMPIGIQILVDVYHDFRRPEASIQDKLDSILYPLYATGAAIVTFTPLILFDIKNHFINLKTLMRATSTGEIQAKNVPYIERFTDTTRSLWHNALGLDVGTSLAILFVLLLLIAIFFIAWRSYAASHRHFIIWCISLVVVFLPLFALLETGRFLHYYNHLYLALYFLVSICLSEIITRIQIVTMRKEVTDGTPPRPLYAIRYTLYALLAVLLAFYTYHNLATFPFLTDPTHQYTQITDAQTVAHAIIDELTSDTYQVVGLPSYQTEDHYRYYLEYYGKRPMPMDTLGDPHELYVICHDAEQAKKDCGIPGNAQWQTAYFENQHPTWHISSVKKVTNVVIYKLVP